MKHLHDKILVSPQKSNRRLVLPILFTFLMVYTAFPLFAQDSEKEERWFEFEVILFKLKSEDGLYAESWKDDSKLKISENAIDFLQPYEILETTLDETTLQTTLDIQGSGETTSAIENLSNDQNSTVETFRLNDGVEKYVQEPTEHVERAFIRLSNDLLQLTSESKSIDQQSRYQLIEHFSWRQPVDSRANATKIRIAGGFDYSEDFEYGGEKKIEFSPITDETLNETAMNNESLEAASENLDSVLNGKLTNENSAISSKHISLEDDIDNEKLETVIVPEPKRLDWVPEIDGEIKVYIHRNYLHVDTNLVYRKPEEITVDIFHLDEQPLNYTFANQSPVMQDLLDAPIAEGETLAPSVISTPPTKFNWEFDSDFLNKKAEKLFTQKLFNYPLIQERRVRSGELHYFDHPLIGMLIMIRPYEIEVFEDDLIELEPSEDIGSIDYN